MTRMLKNASRERWWLPFAGRVERLGRSCFKLAGAGPYQFADNLDRRHGQNRETNHVAQFARVVIGKTVYRLLKEEVGADQGHGGRQHGSAAVIDRGNQSHREQINVDKRPRTVGCLVDLPKQRRDRQDQAKRGGNGRQAFHDTHLAPPAIGLRHWRAGPLDIAYSATNPKIATKAPGNHSSQAITSQSLFLSFDSNRRLKPRQRPSCGRTGRLQRWDVKSQVRSRPGRSFGGGPMPKHRLESFSDGVFAIVITLLILNVHLDRDQELTWQTLASLGPDVLAFALTFVIVGVYWVSHHSMMHMIKAVDRRLLWLNLLLLLAVVFIPFPAYLLGRHLWNPLAAAIYGLNLMTVNALGTLLWFYASSRPGIISEVTASYGLVLSSSLANALANFAMLPRRFAP